MTEGKRRSITFLLLAEVLAMALWFVSSVVLPDMLREVSVSPARQAALTSGVQVGFVIGALFSALLGLADRFDPRRVLMVSAIGAGCVNAILLVAEPGGNLALLVRVLTGAFLAGVYPVGMKIAVGWGKQDRGFLVGALVGALTLGSASPHLISLAGGTDWRLAIGTVSVAAIVAGLLATQMSLGPYHTVAIRFDVRAITTAWTNRRVRLAYLGYFGHMWELYVMWAWVGAATAVSYGATMSTTDAEFWSKVTAFVAIASGGIACAFAGRIGDRIGKAEVTIIAMLLSGTAAVATALTFGGPFWLTFVIVVIWGITIIPDSAQFSALVADAAPPEQAGSLMTLQTAIGFAMTIFTVQLAPLLAATFGWPIVLATLALGPAFGVAAMLRLRAMGSG